MKKLFVLISAVFAFQGLAGQITITREDMPNVGDTTRTSSSIGLTGIDPTLTGPGYNWDFSMLEPQSQSVEGYVSTQSTPIIYQIVFNQAAASIASPINGLNFLPGFEITDAYIFYKETSSNYVRAGYAATIMGVPVPMKFNLPELLYTFPLQANSPADSSHSIYSLDFPNLGYFSIERNRVNMVDGWGTLTTPYGTFNTLRVKSVINERDSLYIDSVQTGVPVSRFYTEYQWLANGFGIPLLTITQEGPLLSAQYIDSLRNLNPLIVGLGPDQEICRGDTISIETEVTGGTPPYTYLWSTLDTTASIKVIPDQTTTYTVLVTDAQNNLEVGSKTITVNEFANIELGPDTLVCSTHSITFSTTYAYDQLRWYIDGELQPQGNSVTIDTTGIGMNSAIVRVEYEKAGCSGSDQALVTFYICEGIHGLNALQFTIMPNPARDILTVEGKDIDVKTSCIIYDLNGRRVEGGNLKITGNRITVDVNKLNPGSYSLVLSDGHSYGAARFVKY